MNNMKKNPHSKTKKQAKVRKQFGFSIIIGLALLIIMPLLVFWYATDLGLSGFDDDIILENAKQIKGIGNYEEAFKRDAFLKYGSGDFYRPLQSLSYLLDSTIGDNSNFVYHLSNLIYHIIFCLILFILLLKLKIDRYIAFGFSLLYSIHPFFVHTVVWIPSRGDILLAIFAVVSLIFYINFLEKRNYLYLVLNVVAFLFAIFSKETALLSIGVFTAYYFIESKNDFKAFLKPRYLTGLAFWIAVVVFYIWFRTLMIGFNPGDSNFKIANFFLNISTIPEFFGKFLVPINLTPMADMTLPVTAIGIIGFVVSFIFLILNKESDKKLFLMGLVWFLAFTLPPMLYRQSTDSFTFSYLEHRAYLPVVGLLMILAAIIPMKEFHMKLKLVIPIFLIVVAGFAYYSNNHGKLYDNPISFYSYIIEKSDNILSAFNNRGNYLMRKGKHKEALLDYNMAIRQNPDAFNTLNNRANCYSILGMLDSSYKDYKRALELKPEAYQIRTNFAMLLQKNNRFEESLEQLNKVLEVNPNYTQAYGARGLTYGKLKKSELAVKDFDKALEFYKHSAFTFFNRGVVKYDLNDFGGALADFNEALKLREKYPEALYFRGVTLIKSAQNDKAMKDLNAALELREFYPEAYFNRGVLFGMYKDYKKAIDDFNLALEQHHDTTLTLRQRGKALYAYGNKNAACQDWEISMQRGDSISTDFYTRACQSKQISKK